MGTKLGKEHNYDLIEVGIIKVIYIVEKCMGYCITCVNNYVTKYADFYFE